MLKAEIAEKLQLSTSQLHTVIKNAGLTIKDVYDDDECLKIQSAAQGKGKAQQPPQPSVDFQGFDTAPIELVQKHQQAIQNQQLEAQRLSAMLQKVQSKAIQVGAEQRLEALSLGLIEPANEAERQIAATYRHLQDLEVSQPSHPFVTIEEETGRVTVNLALPGLNLEAAKQLKSA